MQSKSEPNDLGYKSPLRKLVKFFKSSRDKWKARSAEKQKRIDFLEAKVRDLRYSRDQWIDQVKNLEKQQKPPYRSPHTSENSTNSLILSNCQETCSVLKKIDFLPNPNGANRTSELSNDVSPQDNIAGHKYSLYTMVLGIQMVVEALTSLRGAMKCFELFAQFFPFEIPTWVTIQNWILRFGLHELQQKLPVRTDWVWIVDATIKIGTKKCLLIVGVTMAQLKKSGFNLQHQDLQVLKLEVVEQLNGEIILQHLARLS